MEEIISLVEEIKNIENSSNELRENGVFDMRIPAEKKVYENSKEGELLQQLDETKDVFTRKDLINKILNERKSKLAKLNEKIDKAVVKATNDLRSEISDTNQKIEDAKREIQDNAAELMRLRTSRKTIMDNPSKGVQEAYNTMGNQMLALRDRNLELQAQIKASEAQIETINGKIEDVQKRNFDKLIEEYKKEQAKVTKKVQEQAEELKTPEVTEKNVEEAKTAQEVKKIESEEKEETKTPEVTEKNAEEARTAQEVKKIESEEKEEPKTVSESQRKMMDDIHKDLFKSDEKESQTEFVDQTAASEKEAEEPIQFQRVYDKANAVIYPNKITINDNEALIDNTDAIEDSEKKALAEKLDKKYFEDFNKLPKETQQKAMDLLKDSDIFTGKMIQTIILSNPEKINEYLELLENYKNGNKAAQISDLPAVRIELDSKYPEDSIELYEGYKKHKEMCKELGIEPMATAKRTLAIKYAYLKTKATIKSFFKNLTKNSNTKMLNSPSTDKQYIEGTIENVEEEFQQDHKGMESIMHKASPFKEELKVKIKETQEDRDYQELSELVSKKPDKNKENNEER